MSNKSVREPLFHVAKEAMFPNINLGLYASVQSLPLL